MAHALLQQEWLSMLPKKYIRRNSIRQETASDLGGSTWEPRVYTAAIDELSIPKIPP
jgi:hypothetical protein